MKFGLLIIIVASIFRLSLLDNGLKNVSSDILIVSAALNCFFVCPNRNNENQVSTKAGFSVVHFAINHFFIFLSKRFLIEERIYN